MSSPESPITSLMRPTSESSAATTFQPGSIISHETGSATLDGLSADVPDRALRIDRARAGESPQDGDGAGHTAVVHAREAAPHHLRGRAVAEAARAAEAEADGACHAGRVDRRE